MTHEEKIKVWLELGAKILETCNGVLLQAQFEEKDKTLSNPKVIALTLMCRSVNNFGALRGLVENGFVVEVRTMARCCYENLFWLAGLTVKGDEFVKQMMDDHELSTIKRGNELMQWAKKQEGKVDFEAPLAAFLDKMREQSTARSGVVHKNAAEAGLSRHVDHKMIDGGVTVTLIGEPLVDKEEVEQTLEFGCSSLLGACVAANQVVGGTSAGKGLHSPFDEFLALSNKQSPKS